MMHIAVIQETDWLRRGPHQQHHLFERLSQRGHRVTVFDYPTLRPHWPREPLLVGATRTANAARIYEGARIHLTTPATLSLLPAARPSSLLSHYAALHRLIKADRPDVIVSYALSTGLPALRLAQRYDIPFVFHVIDSLHAIVPAGLLKPAAKAVERHLLQTADEVVVINAHLRDYAINLGADPAKARVLRTGVDLPRFDPTRDGHASRTALGIQPGDVVLFFMGWIYDFSGVLDVARSLLAMPGHVKLLVVGDGDQYEALQHLRDTQLAERLILTGRVPYARIPELIAAADVNLLPFEQVPATEHIVPIKLYEYMASGKPTVATPLPGVRRDIGEGNGVIYAPTHKQAAAALTLLPQADELGQQARAYVETHCDWATITTTFETLLRTHTQSSSS